MMFLLIYQNIKSSLKFGHLVVIVSHSQGNLYTNIAYNSLNSDERKLVKIVAVATPAAYVGTIENFIPYDTRIDDRVIGSVLFALDGQRRNPLESCSANFFSLNHEFVACYLSDRLIENYVLIDITNQIKLVSSVCTPTSEPTYLPELYQCDCTIYSSDPEYECLPYVVELNEKRYDGCHYQYCSGGSYTLTGRGAWPGLGLGSGLRIEVVYEYIFMYGFLYFKYSNDFTCGWWLLTNNFGLNKPYDVIEVIAGICSSNLKKNLYNVEKLMFTPGNSMWVDFNYC